MSAAAEVLLSAAAFWKFGLAGAVSAFSSAFGAASGTNLLTLTGAGGEGAAVCVLSTAGDLGGAATIGAVEATEAGGAVAAERTLDSTFTLTTGGTLATGILGAGAGPGPIGIVG